MRRFGSFFKSNFVGRNKALRRKKLIEQDKYDKLLLRSQLIGEVAMFSTALLNSIYGLISFSEFYRFRYRVLLLVKQFGEEGDDLAFLLANCEPSKFSSVDEIEKFSLKLVFYASLLGK